MKLALQHTDNNPYPRCGIFIKHASPKVWLEEITRMQLKLSDCIIYPCPGENANSISGVLIIFKTAQKRVEVYNNLCVQKVQTGFYIPENTQLNMSLTQEEYTKIVQGKPHFFHHQYGLIELKEEVQWETILQVPNEQFPTIETPAKGVHIPMKVTAFSVEIEEKETESTLENPFGDEKVDPQDLPFDMKKVLEGNNKEVDKYLKYLEKNPEAALKMAVPLDMMGTSRGKAFAKYKFKSNFLGSIGFGNSSEKLKSETKIILGLLALVVIYWVGSYAFDQVNKKSIEVVPGQTRIVSSDSNEISEEPVVFEVNKTNSETLPTETDTGIRSREDATNTNNKYKKDEERVTNMVLNGFLIFIVFVIGFIILGYFITSRKKKTSKVKSKSKKPTSWMDLPEENELFSFNDESETRGSSFYFGGNELSLQSKILIAVIIAALLTYLFYPMLKNPGIEGIFLLIAGFIVVRLLYSLINKNKNIIDD